MDTDKAITKLAEEFCKTCPKCGGKRWKTKIKYKQWQCRKCGYIKYDNNVSIKLGGSQ